MHLMTFKDRKRGINSSSFFARTWRVPFHLYFRP